MVKFCYADFNYHLKIKWADENEEDTFFSCIDDLVKMAISKGNKRVLFSNTIDAFWFAYMSL